MKKRSVGIPAAILCLMLQVSVATAYTLPDPLVANDNTPVTTVDQWENSRRGEILELFREHMYGRDPQPPAGISFTVKDETPGMMDGAATRKIVEICFEATHGTHCFEALIFLPTAAVKPAPVFLLINHRGDENTDPTRTTKMAFWPAEEMIARGYGMAAFQTDSVAPDSKGSFSEKIIDLYDGAGTRDSSAWAAIAAWAWSAGRVMDYFETDEDIDASRIAVVGHSRGGKASLWAGALDQRFALTISNCSGCSGAALSRRRTGETLAKLNGSFPHWFCDKYKQYNDLEDSLPFDQHEVFALIAPRLAYIASASSDNFSDPLGEYLSGHHAGPVYALYGFSTLPYSESPQIETPLHDNRIGHHMREGGHGMELYDWMRFADFADLHLSRSTKSITPSRGQSERDLAPGLAKPETAGARRETDLQGRRLPSEKNVVSPRGIAVSPKTGVKVREPELGRQD